MLVRLTLVSGQLTVSLNCSDLFAWRLNGPRCTWPEPAPCPPAVSLPPARLPPTSASSFHCPAASEVQSKSSVAVSLLAFAPSGKVELLLVPAEQVAISVVLAALSEPPSRNGTE